MNPIFLALGVMGVGTAICLVGLIGEPDNIVENLGGLIATLGAVALVGLFGVSALVAAFGG